MTLEERIAQLERQQAEQTLALRQILEGHLSGAAGAAGTVVALEGGATSIDVAPFRLRVAPAPVLHQWQSNNFFVGRMMGPPIALVIHTEAGSEGGTEATFTNNASQVSAHFGVGLDGRNDEFVQLGDTAWANGIRQRGNLWDSTGLPNVNPNFLTVSIETEDLGSGATPVSDKQYAGVLEDCQLALVAYPSIKWLITHRSISPIDRPNCPGPRWIASGRFLQLAQELKLFTLI